MERLTEELKKQLFPNNTILCGYRGSLAQNTYIPNNNPNSIDDIDLMSVYIAPVEYYIGLGDDNFTFNGKTERYSGAIERFIGPWDTVSYEFRKFVKLLLNSNPNVLSLLWINDEHYINSDLCFYGKMLLNHRDIFVSKKAYHAFTGYAYAQLKKMSSFTKQGYMGAKRKALVRKYGYDTKNAGHLIRLLQMGIEYLQTGELTIFRVDDAEILKEIKTGKWSLERVKKEAEKLFKAAEIAFATSTLPELPDYDKAEELVTTILYDYINNENFST